MMYTVFLLEDAVKKPVKKLAALQSCTGLEADI